MYSLDELKTQNQEISDLCAVLSVLVEQQSLHTNPYVCELMGRFKEKVWIHLVFEDNTIYSALAEHKNANVSNVAKDFHDSARKIKKRFSGYVRRWCNPSVAEDEHDQLVQESREIFQMIRDRVKYENEKMFPLVKEHHAA
jgi:hemerythrin-like domain-containing protein